MACDGIKEVVLRWEQTAQVNSSFTDINGAARIWETKMQV